MCVIHLELDILDHKSPDFITKPIDVEMSLHRSVKSISLPITPTHSLTHLESHPRLHLITQHGGDVLVEIGHDSHGELWFDPPRADQVVQGVCQSEADAAVVRLAYHVSYLLRAHAAYDVPLYSS